MEGILYGDEDDFSEESGMNSGKDPYEIPFRCNRGIFLKGIKFIGIISPQLKVGDMVLTLAVQIGIGREGLAGKKKCILPPCSFQIAESEAEEFSVPILPDVGGLQIPKDVWVGIRFKVNPLLTGTEEANKVPPGSKPNLGLNGLEKMYASPRDVNDANGACFKFLSYASNFVEFFYSYSDDQKMN